MFVFIPTAIVISVIIGFLMLMTLIVSIFYLIYYFWTANATKFEQFKSKDAVWTDKRYHLHCISYKYCTIRVMLLSVTLLPACRPMPFQTYLFRIAFMEVFQFQTVPMTGM